MLPDLSQPKIKTQIDWINCLPASEIAEELLEMVGSPRVKPMPALLDLLAWTVTEGPSLDVDVEDAEAMQQTAMMMAMDDRWADAVANLLNLDDPTEEVPAELLGLETPQDVAEAMNQLSAL